MADVSEKSVAFVHKVNPCR